MAGIAYLSSLTPFLLTLWYPVNYGEQLTFNGEDGSQACFYPGERVLLVCSHIPWYSAALWSYSPVNIPTYIESSGLPSARTVASETNITVHTVEITSAEKTLDGNSLWCGIDTGNTILKSNTITFHIAPGKEQNWTLSLLQHETSDVASFLLMQITFTSHQLCAEKRAIVSHDIEAFNVSSNMTLQEHDKVPLVHNITKTSLNVTNLLRCVRYRHSIRVVYPGLGKTEEKIYEDTSMLRPKSPIIGFTKISAGIGIVAIKTAGTSCHPHQTTSYKATLREVSQKETLAVLWHSQGIRDSSTARNSEDAWTYKGDIPHGQEELVWLVNFTSLTNSSRTKLRVTATFVNTFGEATHTDEFEFALDDYGEASSYDTRATEEVGVGLALYVTTPLLSALTAVSLVTACTLAITLYRAQRKKTGLHTDAKPPIYAAVTRPDIEDPVAAVSANQVNPSYVPLEQLMTSQAV